MEEIYCNTRNRRKWLKIAIERELVPLMATPKLAQVCGHLIGDGHLRLTKRTGGHIKFFGKEEKLKEIAKLYEKLFGKKIKLIKRERDWDPGYKLEFADSVVARCLEKIGVPSGDKVITKFEVPKWIRNGNREIKRSFLQALFDDEMESIYKDKNMKHPNSWKGLRLRMNKSERLIPHALEFFKQIVSLLDEFAIETTVVKYYDKVSYIRPDGTKTYRTVFRVKNNIENRRKFFEEIGFIYDKVKQQKLIESLV